MAVLSWPYTVTWRPALARNSAALRPPGPSPTITTSMLASSGLTEPETSLLFAERRPARPARVPAPRYALGRTERLPFFAAFFLAGALVAVVFLAAFFGAAFTWGLRFGRGSAFALARCTRRSAARCRSSSRGNG